MTKLEEMVLSAPNIEVMNSWLVSNDKLARCRKAVCRVSGGADSDLLVHMFATLDQDKKVTYVFFDTGFELQATKNHIKKLEQKYGIEIVVEKAVKPIPMCCRQYGIPFLSKYVSDMISRLQSHNFKWEDAPFDDLYAKYPNCKGALRWWCNLWGEGSKFNISYNTFLKEFLIANPPNFKISNKCCHYAKKLPSKNYTKNNDFDLGITGIRKAEGGIRSTSYKNCFSPASDNTIDEYRPLFWYRQDTKRAYEETYDITHSDCYEVWGLPRTGCAGCPYGQDLEFELEAIAKYEPKMYKALDKVFGHSYEYTRQYRTFQQMMKEKILHQKSPESEQDVMKS